MALLQHKDIWVGGTGASTHCTNDIVGVQNVCEPSSETTLGQLGTSATPSKLVYILRQLYDQYGEELVLACLTKFRYNPKSCFNLASVWLFMQCGYTMSGGDMQTNHTSEGSSGNQV